MLHARYLGRVSYRDGVALQEEIRARVLEARDARADRAGNDRREEILLLEHDPVYTLGRNASSEDVVAERAWLEAQGIEVAESDRGGQVTYHGPGQLVAYPILDLTPDRRDVRRYVADLERAIVDLLAGYQVTARPGGTDRIGVWVGEQKIASIGVHLKRWVTTHGLALNVAADLGNFQGIVACGMPQVSMTSIEQQTGRRPPLEEVAERCARSLAEVFDRRLIWTGAARP